MKKLKQFIKKNYMFFILSILLLILVFMYIPENVTNNYLNYNFTFYYFTYENGFLSRGLIGTIYHLIFNNVTFNTIYYTTIANITALIIFISYLLSKLISKYKYKNYIIIIVFLLLINPSSFVQMLINSEFGRFDYFLFFNAIICFILIYKNKFLYLIPILSIMSICIHQNFIFTLLPIICSILLYEGVKDKNKLKVYCLIITIMVSFITFLSIYTFGKNTGYATTYEMYEVINQKSDFELFYGPIYWEFDMKLKDASDFILMNKLVNQTMTDYVYASVIFLIYIVFFGVFVFSKIFKHTKNKILFILVLLSPLCTLPLFWIGADYGRWFTAIMTGYSLITAYLLYKNKNIITIKRKKERKIAFALGLMLVIFFALMFQTQEFYYLTFEKIHLLLKNFF